MADLSQFSDEELARIAGVPMTQNRTVKEMTDEELASIAGVDLSETRDEPPIGIAGFLERGVRAAESGATPADIPGIATQAASGALAGIPRFAIENPVAAGVERGAEITAGRQVSDLFPSFKPKTEEGRRLAGEVELAASLIPFAAATGQAGRKLSQVVSASGRKKLQGEISLLDDVEKAARSTRRQAGQRFGKALDDFVASQPDKIADLSDLLQRVSTQAQTNPRIASIVRNVPELEDLISRPRSLNVKEIQNLKNLVSERARRALIEGRDVKFSERDILQLLDDLAIEQSKVFPGMKQVRQEFAEVANAFKLVGRKLSGDPLEISAKRGFKEARSKNALIRLVGETKFKRLEKFGRDKSFREFLRSNLGKAIIGGGASATGAALLGAALFASRGR